MRCLWPLLVFLFLTVGCEDRGDLAFEDDRNPHFAKAAAHMRAQAYQQAARAYEDALRANPNVARAHYEAARIYSDQLSDSVYAMYHLQKFLQMRPESPDFNAAQALLEVEMRRFAAGVPNSPVASAKAIEQLRIENTRLKKALIGKLRSAAILRPPENKPLLDPDMTREELIVETQQIVAEDQKPAETYTIAKGDSLWKISQQFYPDDVMNGIDRIKAANTEALPDGVPLKVGAEIVIPVR